MFMKIIYLIPFIIINSLNSMDEKTYQQDVLIKVEEPSPGSLNEISPITPSASKVITVELTDKNFEKKFNYEVKRDRIKFVFGSVCVLIYLIGKYLS